ncbi:hypothetical protein MF271_18910 (plasmid) [Deinococcus sp. KNUC1210]|uniref:hypothetical protein n=1 Tax=Deinococcus sp. KNUC1210 TaxID=2917691 RepID=UPI001EF0183B|nr:hypothetical protein [Deinococcus sp. KNUC1210]ULH17392.1 hypothetical protein MF271_18910 [Deinococcus sp. KNUC1210]
MAEARAQTRIAEESARRTLLSLEETKYPKVWVYREISGNYISIYMINTGSISLTVEGIQSSISENANWKIIDQDSSEVRQPRTNGIPIAPGEKHLLSNLLEPGFPDRKTYQEKRSIGISCRMIALGGKGGVYDLAVIIDYDTITIEKQTLTNVTSAP